MKKKILGISTMLIIAAAITTWNFKQAKNEMRLSSVALSNVEALAAGEDSDCPHGCLTTSGKCYCRGEHPYKEAS